MLFAGLLDLLVRLWANDDSTDEIISKPVDLIVPISYSILPDRLTKATHQNLWSAIWMQKQAFPNAPIALSNCAYTFPGAANKERELRDSTLLKSGTAGYIIWAEDMNNSIQEARMIRKRIKELGLNPHCILVVTCKMHTRSARYIWKETFPDAEILVYANDWFFEAEPDQPVLIQRSHWLWFFGNIARQVLIRMLGLDRVGGMHHRSQVKANS